MSNPFATPAPTGSGFSPKDHHGRLLLIVPEDYQTGIKTAYGESDAVACSVAVLDGDQAGETFPGTLIFSSVLRSQLRPRLGEKVLGRLGQGEAKPGQSPPWILDDPTSDDIEVGTRFLNADVGKDFIRLTAPVSGPGGTTAAAQVEQAQPKPASVPF